MTREQIDIMKARGFNPEIIENFTRFAFMWIGHRNLIETVLTTPGLTEEGKELIKEYLKTTRELAEIAVEITDPYTDEPE